MRGTNDFPGLINAVAPGVMEGVGLVESAKKQQTIAQEEEALIKELGERGMLTQPGRAGQFGKQLVSMFVPSRTENYDRRALIEATAKQLAQDRGDNLGLSIQQSTIFYTGAPAQKIFRSYLRKVLDETKAIPLAEPSSYAHPADDKDATHFRDKLAQRQSSGQAMDTALSF